jgi:hypothetical protein
VNHIKPDLKVDFSPFENVGCEVDWPGFFSCSDQSTLGKIGCQKIEENDLLGGLTPSYPIAVCRYWFYPPGSRNVPTTECFSSYLNPGDFVLCNRFIIFKDGKYSLIKNLDQFRNIFAPVDSPAEALSFALTDDSLFVEYGLTYHDTFKYSVPKVEDSFVSTVDDGFLVHVFDIPEYGCSPYDLEAVEVKVTRDGQTIIINRSPVYHNPSGGGMCPIP